ncbi:MAG: Hypothetical protein AJITA_00986 [Acetilactobacillus jinshanensis]
MKLAKNLKTYRQKNHLTQSKLANKLHVSRKTISNWENGRSQPSFQTLNALSKIYEVPTVNPISYYLNIVLLILI